jgi:hypothetical protein
MTVNCSISNNMTGTVEILKPISKFLSITGQHIVVIPAQAGIHVFNGFKWPPAFAGVTDS